ncbi:MAG: YggS family pyridoxal phosphate-dependent enzyme [Proteobacteria bacterium]|nr:YggS family pyridoxal phosphate-dependent enzyme [Pseudomonadota bacterium]MBU1715951.1 YggS family pyridoxal phosphate-dependent enzyme [Pseudomonadota bacterium]
MSEIKENLEKIRDRISTAARRAGRSADSVRLVAVSKKMPFEKVQEAMACGQMLFGESYLQEARQKIASIGAGPTWHFIGHVQSNKAKGAAELFDTIETVDRLKLARELDRNLAEAGRQMSILIQINIGREAQKSGVLPEGAEALLAKINELPNLQIKGLMTMPPFLPDPEAVRPYFRQLRLLAEKLEKSGLLGLHGKVELSMGMSGDFEVAIEEGATLVRVGTAIFGDRPY